MFHGLQLKNGTFINSSNFLPGNVYQELFIALSLNTDMVTSGIGIFIDRMNLV